MSDEPLIAVFVDYENLALGVRDMKKGEELRYEASSPLVAIQSTRDGYRVSYGNRRVTRLHPQFFEYDSSLDSISIQVDGRERRVGVGSVVALSARSAWRKPLAPPRWATSRRRSTAEARKLVAPSPSSTISSMMSCTPL